MGIWESGIYLAKTHKTKSGELSVGSTFETLVEIAKDAGEKAWRERRIKWLSFWQTWILYLQNLLRGFLWAKLRLGFSDKTVLDALSWMKRE
jgi:hypothetical protein